MCTCPCVRQEYVEEFSLNRVPRDLTVPQNTLTGSKTNSGITA